MFWEGKKGSEHIHPEDLGFSKLFEAIQDEAIVADTKTQRIVLWNPAATGIFGYSSPVAIVRDVTERNRAEEFAAQLLRHLSVELVSEPDITLLPNVASEPRVPLQETQEVKLTARKLEVLRLLALGKIILRCVNTGGKR